MLTVLALMTAGIFIGLFVRKFPQLVKATDKLTTWAIYLLLFLLGISVGLNQQIIDNLESIGVTALLITLGSVLGSLVAAWCVYNWFFKNSNIKSEEHER